MSARVPVMSATRHARAAAVLVIVVAAAGALRALPAAGATPAPEPAATTPSAAYQRALSLGIEAYVYGYPLLDMIRVFKTSTSVNVPNGSGAGPVNEFSHFRRLTNPSDTTVVAPNHDTLYSMAWLDLRAQPIIIHMPVIKSRFVVFELLDPYTENFASIGSVGHPAGDYAVAPPAWHGRLPSGVRLLRSPYTRVWVIGRTYIKDAADTPNVVRIQNRFTLTPLSKWGTSFTPPRRKHIDRTLTEFSVPGTQSGQNPLAFFDALGDALGQFPPPARDRPLLSQLATVGIGPGRHPSTEAGLAAATRQGLHDAVAAGAAQITADIRSAFLTDAPKHNGWLVEAAGRYGTDYTMRAVADAIGLGAPQADLAIYPFTLTDRDLHPLTGANRYVAHFSKADLPFPVKAFWSITLYNSKSLFVPNAAHIYLVNNRSDLHYNPDGSLDVYIQPQPPSNPLGRRNWLPSPAGQAFRLLMRLYEPTHIAGILSGRTWQPPAVLPCLPTGMTATGTPCAT